MEFYQSIHDELQLFSFSREGVEGDEFHIGNSRRAQFIFPVWSWQDLSSIIPPGLYRTYRTLQLFSGWVGREESNIRSRLCECLHWQYSGQMSDVMSWCHNQSVTDWQNVKQMRAVCHLNTFLDMLPGHYLASRATICQREEGGERREIEQRGQSQDDIINICLLQQS